jgi:hypothetical protein
MVDDLDAAAQGPAPLTDPSVWRPRMRVGVKPAALKDRKLAHIMPIRLITFVGWPNNFLVNEVIDFKGKPHLSLWPCCFWLINRRTGGYLCKVHPAEYFEPLQGSFRPPQPGDAHAAINTPFGKIVDLDYQDDASEPLFTVKMFGFPVQITGEPGRQIWEILKAKMGGGAKSGGGDAR